jgi:TolB-like protein
MLEGGERFSKTTATALAKADVVVVLWSKTSIESHWVHDEATHGRDNGRLVPVTIDGSEGPLGFRQFQMVDLSRWKGKASAAEIMDLRRAIGIATNAPASELPHRVSIDTKPNRRLMIAAGGGATLAAIGGGFTAWHLGWFKAGRIINSVAVLPFKNLSGDPSQDYFSDGLAEEIRAALSRNPLLQVAAPTSSGMFRGGAAPVAEISSKLGVAYILDGSVRRRADSVRIAAHLIDGKTGLISWSRTIDTALEKVLAAQSRLAETVAEVLTAQVEGKGFARAGDGLSQSGGTTNTAAFEAYLLGKEAFHKADDIVGALANINQAIEIDPKYAVAHSERSRLLTHQARSLIDTTKNNPTFERSIAAARRAISLAPSLAIAHSQLGFALTYGHMSVAEARGPYERSRKLGWGDAHVVISYAVYMSTLGRHDAALDMYKRAVAIDPLNSQWLGTLAGLQYNARLFDKWLISMQKLSKNRQKPFTSTAHNAVMHLYRNEPLKAEKAAAQLTDQGRIAELRPIIAYKKGNYELARRSLEALIQPQGDAGYSTSAWVYAGQGRKDLALDALEKAYQVGDWWLIDAYHSVFFDVLRKEPRFIDLYKKMGFE